jgi:hypothetical protein
VSETMGYAMAIEKFIPPMGEPWDHKTILMLHVEKYREAMNDLAPDNAIGRRIVQHMVSYGVAVPSAFDWTQLVARLCGHIRHTTEGDPEQVEEAIRAIRPRLATIMQIPTAVPLPA